MGSCTVVDVGRDERWVELARTKTKTKEEGKEEEVEEAKDHKHACKFILLCPTMRVPREVKWDKEVVFDCIWALLCAIDLHNQNTTSSESRIESILMTPLATGVGRVSEARWAAQCVLAMKYWIEAVEKPEKWGNLQWADVYGEIADLIDGSVEL